VLLGAEMEDMANIIWFKQCVFIGCIVTAMGIRGFEVFQ